MFDPNDINSTKADIIKATTVLSLSHLARVKFLNIEAFSNKWLYSSIAILVGFTVHGLITKKLNKKVNLKGNKKNALQDVIKFGTVLLVEQLVITAINGDMELSSKFLQNTGLVLAGYVIFNLYLNNLIPNSKYKATIHDILRTSTGLLFADYIVDFDIDTPYSKFLTSFFGIAAFHLLVKPRVLN